MNHIRIHARRRQSPNQKIEKMLILAILLFTLACQREVTLEDFTLGVESSFLSLVDDDHVSPLVVSTDGGYAAVMGASDGVLLKFDEQMNEEWRHTYGGTNGDWPLGLIQTHDDGFLVWGTSRSSDGDIPRNQGDSDIWLFKVSSTGDLEWSQTYGGSGTDSPSSYNNAAVELEDRYCLIGYTNSNDGDVSEAIGEFDVWIITVDLDGNLLWERSLGSQGNDYGRQLLLQQGNIVASMLIGMPDAEFTARGNWVSQIDKDGNVNWFTRGLGVNTGQMVHAQNDQILFLNTGENEILPTVISPAGEGLDMAAVPTPANEGSLSYVGSVYLTDNGEYLIGGSYFDSQNTDAFVLRLNADMDLVYTYKYLGNSSESVQSLYPTGSDSYLLQIRTRSTNFPELEYMGMFASVFYEMNEVLVPVSE